MDFLKNKKVLIALGALAFLILVFLLITAFRGKGTGGTATSTDPGSAFGGNTGGDSRPINGTTGGNTSGGNQQVEEAEHAALFQISDKPVTTFTTFSSAGVNFTRFVDRATGHILETGLESIHPVVVSNVTIPRVEKAAWEGNTILYQYLSGSAATVRSFLGTFAKNTDPNGLADTVSGFFIDDNSSGAALKPGGGAVFSLFKSGDGSSGVITDSTTRNRSVIFSSPLSELLVDWPTANTIVVTTKPDESAAGIVFFVDPKTGGATIQLQGKNLTAKVNPTAEKILYSEMKSAIDPSDPSTITSVVTLRTGENKQIALTTLPEKCVWSRIQSSIVYCFVPRTLPTSKEQLAWYRGEFFFSDNLWKIDTESGMTSLLSLPLIDARIEIDAVDPSVSTDEHYLLFRNKKDGILFGYRMPNPPQATGGAATGTTTPSR